MGDNMFRLKDRFGRDLCLGMTHEEIMTGIARGELRSYKQLPQIWYQIQTKFRDEPRPKSGLLRVRQFIMKDSYSFDMDGEGLDLSYKKHYEAYRKIFARCGLEVIPVEAHSGAMGGSQSMEFMVPSDAGEDFVVSCPACHYAANLEKAISQPVPPPVADPETDAAPEEFHTPGKKTIVEVAEFTRLPQASQIKSPQRFGIAGNSAGANLAVVLAREGSARLALQLLLCPVLSPLGRTPSRAALAAGWLIEEATMAAYWNFYRVADLSPDDPRVAPLNGGDFVSLPPALVHVAEFDPLRDEGEAYAAALTQAGVRAELTVHAGLIHHFYGLGGVVPAAQAALARVCDGLKRAWSASA